MPILGTACGTTACRRTLGKWTRTPSGVPFLCAPSLGQRVSVLGYGPRSPLMVPRIRQPIRSRAGWLGSTRQAVKIRIPRREFSLLSPIPLNSCKAQSLRSICALYDASNDRPPVLATPDTACAGGRRRTLKDDKARRAAHCVTNAGRSASARVLASDADLAVVFENGKM